MYVGWLGTTLHMENVVSHKHVTSRHEEPRAAPYERGTSVKHHDQVKLHEAVEAYILKTQYQE